MLNEEKSASGGENQEIPNPNPTPIEIQTPPPPPPMEHKPIYKNKLFLGFIVISALLAFLIGGYFLGKNSSKILQPAVVSPTPTPIDETADWREVSNNTFSIKIPNNWFIESNNSDYIRVQNYDPKNAPGRGYDPTQDKGLFAAQIGKIDKQASNTEELKEVIKALDRESESSGFVVKETKDTTVLINGISGIKRTSMENPNEAPILYFLNGKGGVFFFTPSLDISSEKRNFELILSAFKFTQ
ncbi:MAG: hypothetical protein AAB801_01880 [Patescibacteria group bacterium]